MSNAVCFRTKFLAKAPADSDYLYSRFTPAQQTRFVDWLTTRAPKVLMYDSAMWQVWGEAVCNSSGIHYIMNYELSPNWNKGGEVDLFDVGIIHSRQVFLANYEEACKVGF